MTDRAVNIETVIGMVNTYFRNVLNLNPDLLIDGIVSLPTVDAVPVVRCRDCKYWDTVSGSTFAPMHHQCKITKLMSTGTWYCASGERKNDDT